MTGWFRVWEDMADDPKWGAIAKTARVPAGLVLALAVKLLTRASTNEDRGSIDGYSVPALAYGLGCKAEKVEAMLAEMEALGVIADGRFAAWERRQPKREDDSAERVRAHRARQKQAATAVTQRNAPEAEAETEAEKTAAAAAPPESAEPAAQAAAAALVDLEGERDRGRRSAKTDEAVDLHRWICQRAGAPNGYRDDLGTVRAWLERGLTATEIRDGVGVVLNRQNGQLPTSLRYFEGAIMDQRQRRGRSAAPPKPAPAEARVIDWRTADREAWRQPLRNFGKMARERGPDQQGWPAWARWLPVMGPPPGAAGCWAPADLIAEALAGIGDKRAAGGRR